MYKGKKFLITGGTGSLGTALTKRLLKTDAEIIRIFSRDEWKQTQMQSSFNDDKRLRFFIGDIRDKDRLVRALEDIDIVIHAAALKHVHVAEYNPFEAVKTNVYGAANVIEACFDANVKKVIAIGTDKAVSPFNTYGATKLLMERLFISANHFKGKHNIEFSCVRYGNVLGSRGSIVPLFVDQIKCGKKITITDPTMTRFNITMTQALDLIMRAIKYKGGGIVLIPKLKAYRVEDIKNAITELLDAKNKVKRIPLRPGEKYHESLISIDEIRNTYETKEDYIILQETKEWESQKFRKMTGIRKSILKEKYSSDGVRILTKDEIKSILVKEKLIE